MRTAYFPANTAYFTEKPHFHGKSSIAGLSGACATHGYFPEIPEKGVKRRKNAENNGPRAHGGGTKDQHSRQNSVKTGKTAKIGIVNGILMCYTSST